MQNTRAKVDTIMKQYFIDLPIYSLFQKKRTICSRFEDILKCMEACLKTKIAVLECTLPKKKRNFNLPIFPGAASYLTLTKGHVML